MWATARGDMPKTKLDGIGRARKAGRTLTRYSQPSENSFRRTKLFSKLVLKKVPKWSCLLVSGTTEVGVVDNPAEADRRQYEVPELFTPFSDADRVALFFDAATLQFLSSISASLQTYIDIELEAGA